MKFLMMIYCDDTLLAAMPAGEFDTKMRGCLEHADELRADGRLLDTQQLEAPATGKTIRVRNERMTVLDGPFAETKEYLGGFNVIEADSLDEAVRIAAEFPWAHTGSIEVRPVRDVNAVRRRVGAPVSEPIQVP
ncbi:MAG: YciI family protein [Rhodanobacter sp.]